MTINKLPFLRTSREFPENSSQALSVEINKAYLDIANKVNERTIGLFPSRIPANNGETWFTGGAATKQQGLRQIYPFTFTSSPFSIPHGIINSQISGFIRIWGTFVDLGNVWYPLPYVDATSAANQVAVKVMPGTTPTNGNIVITVGAGAPVPVTGYVVLEWLSNT